MVLIVYGTIGEYIKLFPLIQELGPKRCRTINVNMQPQQLSKLFATSELPKPDISVLNGYGGRDVDTTFRMIVWLLRLTWRFVRLRGTVKSYKKKQPTILVVHGDTIITPLGALFGRYFYRVPVAHIEAGYRSGNLREPFPEELDRIITDHISTINYAVGPETVAHLAKTKGRVVDTKYNTVVDAFRYALRSKALYKPPVKLPKKYVLVSMHRSEIISRKDVMTKLVDLLGKNRLPVVWLDHAVTQEKLSHYGLNELLKKPHITRIPKQPYIDFIRLVSGADCIITDSGGLQEEAHFIGIPCLIHRNTNEKPTMGILSHLDPKQVMSFLRGYPEIAKEQVSYRITTSPTKRIVADLKAAGFVQ